MSNDNQQADVTFLWNGSPITARQGDSIAAALWRAGITTLARSRKPMLPWMAERFSTLTTLLPVAVTVRTRPPLAGSFGGAYVVFAKFGENWKPSVTGSSRPRDNIMETKWGVADASVGLPGLTTADGAFAIAADGTFSIVADKIQDA